MTSFSKTSIVYNNDSKFLGLVPYYYRLRACDTHLTNNSAADQYQRLKLIQNTVRVYSSLYTANLAPLNAYVQPTKKTYNVCWNQMSDRPVPSVQKATIPTGFYNALNGRHNSVTSSKPGCQTPGGIGCDIKHNSYDRYLNRLKGKGPMRRGVIPPTFGAPIPFNPAIPVYGGKTTKTSIVSGCHCPIGPDNKQLEPKIFNNSFYNDDVNGSGFTFIIGQSVYVKKNKEDSFYSVGKIVTITGELYFVEFKDNTVNQYNFHELLIYFPCNCDISVSSTTTKNASIDKILSTFGSTCSFENTNNFTN
jgi:hypothetical protein